MTDTRVAYALREPYAGGSYLGGVVSAGAATLNLAELLEEGGGIIVVDIATGDGNLAAAVLDERPELKRVAVPDAAAAGAPLESLRMAELRDRARTEGLTGTGTKDELVRALLQAATMRANGDDPAGHTVTDLATAYDAAVAGGQEG